MNDLIVFEDHLPQCTDRKNGVQCTHVDTGHDWHSNAVRYTEDGDPVPREGESYAEWRDDEER